MSWLRERIESLAFDVLPVPVLVWIMRSRCARRARAEAARAAAAGPVTRRG